MEILEEKIKKFLEINVGYGYGSGSGSGYGSGDGSGYGYGSSSGYGYGSGSGSGSGYGSGAGYGYGDGSGSGSSSGSGSGSGYGSGYGSGSGSGCNISSFDNKTVYSIDNVQTIIVHVNQNVAKGFILNRDLTLENCYIVKGQNKFAHGKTIKEAMQSLQEKIFENMDSKQAIEEFKKKFKKDEKYEGVEFYIWHHILTGSCTMGRDNFIKNHEIDLNKKYSVKEFIEVCENDYGGKIIQELKKFY